VAWQREGTLELNPNFQRRPVWKKGAKSYLIDTILRGLPIPIIFLRDIPADLRTFKAKRDVVDGQQRIRTVLSFISRDLLKDFEEDRDDFTISKIHNHDVGGKTFKELSKDDKQKILDYQFSVHSFPSDTDDREILQIFARMNSTGVKLNAQELRNAEFFGIFKTAAYEMATEQLNRWRDWGIFTPDQIARMSEVELTSEFMILIMSGVLAKDNNVIRGYYEKYDEDFRDRFSVTDRFRRTFELIEKSIRVDNILNLFRSRTMFFALFVILYAWQYGMRAPEKQYKGLSVSRPKKITQARIQYLIKSANSIKEQTAPEAVVKALRGATTDASARRALISYLAGKTNDPLPRG